MRLSGHKEPDWNHGHSQVRAVYSSRSSSTSSRWAQLRSSSGSGSSSGGGSSSSSGCSPGRHQLGEETVGEEEDWTDASFQFCAWEQRTNLVTSDSERDMISITR